MDSFNMQLSRGFMEFDLFDVIMIKNFIYSIFGIVVGILASIGTYKLFKQITHFDIPSELEKGNLAVGMVVGGIFIMIGLIVGLIIGMSLN